MNKHAMYMLCNFNLHVLCSLLEIFFSLMEVGILKMYHQAFVQDSTIKQYRIIMFFNTIDQETFLILKCV